MRWLWLAPVGLVALAAVLAHPQARAQEAGPVYLGAGSCAAQACHGGTERGEYKIWSTRDEHRLAYEHLTGDLGRRIGTRLGIDPTKSPDCLNCHGTPSDQTAKTFDASDGVHCELCHGSAVKWLGPHAEPKWKKAPAAAKAKLGLSDLSTAAKRAALCVECHVGEAGRDITHRIMAAGHPPLSFDVAKFLRDMPPHWKPKADLTDAETIELLNSTWVEGARAAAKARLEQAARAAEKPDGWPEFAVFDCYSCHHPMYSGSAYERAARGEPGDLAVDLASLDVLRIATTGKKGAPVTFTPGASPAEFAAKAIRAAKAVAAIEPDTSKLRQNIQAHLELVAKGDTRTPRFEMEQLAFAIDALATSRTADFDAALRELYGRFNDTYDAKACAEAALTALRLSK